MVEEKTSVVRKSPKKKKLLPNEERSFLILGMKIDMGKLNLLSVF
jgi:hypothetical protein